MKSEGFIGIPGSKITLNTIVVTLLRGESRQALCLQIKRQGPMACVLNSHLAVGLTSFDSDLTCFFAVQHGQTSRPNDGI